MAARPARRRSASMTRSPPSSTAASPTATAGRWLLPTPRVTRRSKANAPSPQGGEGFFFLAALHPPRRFDDLADQPADGADLVHDRVRDGEHLAGGGAGIRGGARHLLDVVGDGLGAGGGLLHVAR